MSELRLDGMLDLRVGLEVDATRRFVEDNDCAVAEQCTRHGHQLSLALREVGPPNGDLHFEDHIIQIRGGPLRFDDRRFLRCGFTWHRGAHPAKVRQQVYALQGVQTFRIGMLVLEPISASEPSLESCVLTEWIQVLAQGSREQGWVLRYKCLERGGLSVLT